VVRSKVEIEVRRMTCGLGAGRDRLRWGEGKLRTPARQLVLLLENPGTQTASCQLDAWIHDVPDLTQTRARYKLEVEAVDRALGSLVAELRRRDVYDNTVIVFTADHGTALGEHGRVGAGQGLYDELLRVPLILKPLHDWDGATSWPSSSTMPCARSTSCPPRSS
jgi:arylsulfatase A-like enzyme